MARQAFFLPIPPVSPLPGGKRGRRRERLLVSAPFVPPLTLVLRGVAAEADGGMKRTAGACFRVERFCRENKAKAETKPGKQGESRNQNRTAGVRLLRRKRQTEKNRPETSIAFGAESSLCAKKYIRFCNTYQNMGQKNRKIRKRLKIFFNITIFLHISS